MNPSWNHQINPKIEIVSTFEQQTYKFYFYQLDYLVINEDEHHCKVRIFDKFGDTINLDARFKNLLDGNGQVGNQFIALEYFDLDFIKMKKNCTSYTYYKQPLI